MHSGLEVSEVPSGLEVGLPPSPGTSNPSARKPVPSHGAPSTMQDSMSQYPSEDGNKYLTEAGGISKPRRNPWGLSPLMFGLLVALITLIIVGAALGGGLGGSLALAQKKNKYALSCNAPARLKLEIIPISNAHNISLQCANPVFYILNNHCIIYHILSAHNFIRNIHNIHNRDSRHLQ
jgi:hypothetical protein